MTQISSRDMSPSTPDSPSSSPPPEQASAKSTTARVGKASELALGQMKMAKVGERRIAVIRTQSGIHALDNACPHQGYGLTTGALTDEMVVCQWHNWKFDVRTGECTQGEEDVACHPVTLDGDDIVVTVTEPTNDELRAALWPSLRRGFENDYMGQVSRDAVRLLKADADPRDILWEGVKAAAPRNDYGPDHEMAMAADCLTVALERTDETQALALVQGLSGLAETTRDRPERSVPPARQGIDLAAAIEDERVDDVMAATMQLIAESADPSAIRHEFVAAASRHHLGYGHGIIYVQKAFELLDHVGWDRAADLLPHTAVGLAMETREDLLPYMRPTMKLIDAADLEALATAEPSTDWDRSSLIDDLLESPDAPIAIAIEAVLSGAGIEGLLDALSLASARRLLRHDLEVEFDPDDSINWLSITHVHTMTNAVRWAWTHNPGPDVAKAALFATWLLHDSSRGERRHGVGPEMGATPQAGDIGRAVRYKDVQAALNAVAAMGYDEAGNALIDAAMADQSGAFIVVAHQIKLSLAAREEAKITDSHLPLLAAARYLASPRNERFVARNLYDSVDFVTTGKPPIR